MGHTAPYNTAVMRRVCQCNEIFQWHVVMPLLSNQHKPWVVKQERRDGAILYGSLLPAACLRRATTDGGQASILASEGGHYFQSFNRADSPAFFDPSGVTSLKVRSVPPGFGPSFLKLIFLLATTPPISPAHPLRRTPTRTHTPTRTGFLQANGDVLASYCRPLFWINNVYWLIVWANLSALLSGEKSCWLY